MLTYEELEEGLSEILPSGFEIVTNSHGRITIKTTLVQNEDGDLIDSEEDSEEGLFDDDTEQLDDEDDEEDE